MRDLYSLLIESVSRNEGAGRRGELGGGGNELLEFLGDEEGVGGVVVGEEAAEVVVGARDELGGLLHDVDGEDVDSQEDRDDG